MNGFTLLLSMAIDKIKSVPLWFRLLALAMVGLMIGLML